ncbi:MAG: AAA family ATPase [Promethearchaeota archaeon]
MSISEVRSHATNILDEVGKVIVGKRNILQNILIGLLAKGHILLEGVPGIAKTYMANAFAQAIGCEFKRIQFTPDMLPADIVGTNIYDPNTGEFRLRKGPVFSNLVLADEVNRSPPKTQSALLEAMQEKQVTIEGATLPLPEPFMVLATQNPIELEGTYPLPEAQVDRFLFKLHVDYPSDAEEVEILRRKHQPEEADVEPVVDPRVLIDMQEATKRVFVEPYIMSYIRDIVVRTRNDPQILIGGSPRASIVLLDTSKVHAALSGRDYVTPDDIKMLALQALNHRLILKPEAELEGTSVQSVVNRILKQISTPGA